MSNELRQEAWERRRERDLIERKRGEFAMDLRAVAGTAEGRRLLVWLVRRGDLFRPDYQPGLAGAYAAGKKAAALELTELLRAALPREDFVSVVIPETAEQDGDGANGFAVPGEGFVV